MSNMWQILCKICVKFLVNHIQMLNKIARKHVESFENVLSKFCENSGKFGAGIFKIWNQKRKLRPNDMKDPSSTQ